MSHGNSDSRFTPARRWIWVLEQHDRFGRDQYRSGRIGTVSI
jgi:hypothetical protein